MVLCQSPKTTSQIVIHETAAEGGDAPPMNYSQKRITRNDRLQSKEEGEANQSVESIVEASSQIVDEANLLPLIIY